MKIKVFYRSIFSIFVTVPLLFALLVTERTAVAASEAEIEASITDGITWLADNQVGDGSWSSHTAITCMALIKLQDRAYELGFASPFDPLYPYKDNVIDGWEFVLNPARTQDQAIGVQTHGDPDTNGNGYGVRFMYDMHHRNYTTGICLMALAASGTPDRLNDGGLNLNGGVATYLELAQDTVDWLAWSQTDGGAGVGGWDYDYHDNDVVEGGGVSHRADNSISGYVTMGLAVAQNFGATVPSWVKDQLSIWIDFIQDDSATPNNGGSSYAPGFDWVNLYKTGHLLFELTFVGDANTSARFEAALGYIERFWQDSTTSPGWGYNMFPADYQAMFALMKGLEFSTVQLIDTDGDTVRDDDWFNQEPTVMPSQDFASVLVAQQFPDGSWLDCEWGGGTELCTIWALLTLEKIAPTSETLKKEITSGPDELDPTDLISDGDFETGDLNGAMFWLGTGDFDEWYLLSPWQLATSGGNQYLNHVLVGGGGGDQKAFQVIDASGMKAGAKLSMEFDYIYNEGDHQIQGVYAGLVGIKSDGIGSKPVGACGNPDPPLYAAFGGTEWDGWGFTFCGPLPSSPGRANPDAFVLATTNKLGVTGAGAFEEGSLEAVLDQEYDAIVVVLRADRYTSPWNTGIPEGMRSFDNVRLYASDGEIDLVVEMKPSEPIHYDYTITYEGEKENVVVVDTIPAEWNVTQVEHTTIAPPLACGESEDFYRCSTIIGELFKGGKSGKKCQSATQLWWTHFMVDTLKIDAETRESPGKGHKDAVFAPTSCGALYLNEGAAAYPAVDGEPLLYEDPLHVSNALCVAVVSDVNGDGIIVRNGSGDEDGDGLNDWEEACEIGTDPCNRDHDGDGVSDGAEVASGCMNPFSNDTDGDSLLDGVEDANQNGVVDEGETDPCDSDTDDDGVTDFWDECPLDGDMGSGIDAYGCPLVSCQMVDNYGYEWNLVLEDDGVVVSWASTAQYIYDSTTVSGSVNPLDAVSLTATNDAPVDGCHPTDTFTYTGTCTGGTSCSGTWVSYDNGGVCESSVWSGTFASQCLLWGQSAAAPMVAAAPPALTDGPRPTGN